MLNASNMKNAKTILINLSGVRLLVIFSLLLESPKNIDEIAEYFIENSYPKELFSADTLRNDLNLLRLAGCEISRANRYDDNRYVLTSHPFELDFDIEIAKSLLKIYNRIYKDLSVVHLMLIDDLFLEISKYAKSEEVSEFLRGISLIKNLNKEIINDLLKAKASRSKISFVYKAPNTGKQTFEFFIEDLEVRNRKLYFSGYNVTLKKNSFLLVSRIVSTITFFLKSEKRNKGIQKVVYELRNIAKMNFEPAENEKIIEFDAEKIVVELTSDNKFKIIQKILSYGPDCTVISPEEIKQEVIETLMRMRSVYEKR